MSNKVYYLAIILPFLLICFSGCSVIGNSSAQDEVVFDDGYKSPAKDEVVFDDNFFPDQQNSTEIQDQQNSTENFSGKSRETTQIAKDGSFIDVTYDGFGNKTETRTFNGNPLLKLIMLRTGVDGSKKVFVYAKNGEVKSLPEQMLGKILTAPPGELANAAGIYEGVKEESDFTQSSEPTNYTTLKPLPSSQFPVRNQQIEQTPRETEEPPESSEKPQLLENKNNDEPTAKTEKQTDLNKKSDEER